MKINTTSRTLKSYSKLTLLLLCIALVTNSASAEKLSPLLQGSLNVKEETQPVRTSLYTDGIRDYVTISYDLLAKTYIGAVHISQNNCFETYIFAGVSNDGDALSLNTTIPRYPLPPNTVCLMSLPIHNARGLAIDPEAREIRSKVFGNLHRPRLVDPK